MLQTPLLESAMCCQDTTALSILSFIILHEETWLLDNKWTGKMGTLHPPQLSWFFELRALLALQTRFNPAEKPPMKQWLVSAFWSKSQTVLWIWNRNLLLLLASWQLTGNNPESTLIVHTKIFLYYTSRALSMAPVIRIIMAGWQLQEHIYLLWGICLPSQGQHTYIDVTSM